MAVGGFGQTEDLDKKIDSQSQELKQLRQEIDKLNKALASKKKSEKATLNTLRQLDKQVDMINKLQRGLKRERQLKREQIEILQQNIDANSAKIAVMKERYARRVVKAYKLGRTRDIEWLLNSDDVNQAVRRNLYFQAVYRAESQLLAELETRIAENTKNQDQLQRRLREVEGNLQEEERNARQLSEKKSQKKNQLDRLKKDQSSLNQEMKEKKTAIQKIEKLITDLEAQKQQRLRELARRRGVSLEQAAGAFARSKGEMNWPVEGRVSARFGNQKNERLGTITDNPGITIRAPKGKPVRAVMDGIVVGVTWIPSFGNTLILDHGAGYYTVYAHVEDIQVNVNAYVLKDQIVAKVGETGSLDGAKLHFEIWKSETKEDPLKWLKR
jgi:septal ring factor EnvC (AmiA/AmiB activator)